MSKFLLISTVSLAVLTLLITASAANNDLGDLKQLLSPLNDPKMTVKDLAFFLATHNYDARPAKDCVELRLESKVYKLTLNGDRGLCNIVPLKLQ